MNDTITVMTTEFAEKKIETFLVGSDGDAIKQAIVLLLQGLTTESINQFSDLLIDCINYIKGFPQAMDITQNYKESITQAQFKVSIIKDLLSFEDGYKLHTQLRAIDHNILISQLKPYQYADKLEVFPSRKILLEKFRDFPQVIANTEALLGDCTFTFDFSAHRNKFTFTGNREDNKRLLRKYAMEGFSSRYQESDKVAIARINHELKIIDELNFSVYFLINDDICRYARSRGFAYVGRGSGANSAVAYCLHITDVCPIELNLPFERFLNPKRKSAPDFDIDVRHEVAQFEYG